MKWLLYIFLFSASLSGWTLGDPLVGQGKAVVCSACHGDHGQSINPSWPNLAGQHAAYLAQQLRHYQAGKDRSSPLMSSLVTNLSPQDMEDLAAFYAQQPNAPRHTSLTPSVRGEQLYRQGDVPLHIPACIACHGPDGRGGEQAGFPMISHQQSDYIVQQLQAFKAGTRSSDPLKIMRTLCAQLTPKDMEELAQYLGGL